MSAVGWSGRGVVLQARPLLKLLLRSPKRLLPGQAWSNRESGTRGVKAGRDREIIEKLGEVLDVGSHERIAIIESWSALSLRDAVPPRTGWAHNFTQAGGPVWLWLWGDAGGTTPTGRIRWGSALNGSIHLQTDRNGLIVQIFASVANPPIEVDLDSPGWVAFGQGTIPREVADALGAEYIDGRELIVDAPGHESRLADDEWRTLFPVVKHFWEAANRFGLNWKLVGHQFGMLRADPGPHPLHLEQTPLPENVPGFDGAALFFTGPQMVALRKARGLSRGEVARQVTNLSPSSPFSASQLEALEKSGRRPDVPNVLARLDIVYQTDGVIGVERTFYQRNESEGRGKFRLIFPRYWQGPVWIYLHEVADGNPQEVTMTWGWWVRRQISRSGELFTTRKAHISSDPLSVEVPGGWTVSAGTGRSPDALDINQGWYPVSVDAARRVLFAFLEDGRKGGTVPPRAE